MKAKELTRIALGSVAGALLGAVAFLGIEGAAPRAADAHGIYGENHLCSVPTDRSDKESVKRFRMCIEYFVGDQNAAIKTHKASAQEAIDDWHIFAKGN